MSPAGPQPPAPCRTSTASQKIYIPDRAPERMSEDMPERMSKDMPEKMPERVSEDMAERMSEKNVSRYAK